MTDTTQDDLVQAAVAAEREKIKGLVIIDEAGTVTPEMWDIAAAIREGGE